MRALVLATTSSEKVMRTARALERERPGITCVVGVPEVEEWKYTADGDSTLVLGEQWLSLDSPATREKIDREGFDLTLLPMGVPRQAFLYLARYVRSKKDHAFLLEAGPLRLRKWWLIVPFLVVFSFVCFGPISLFLRTARWLDGGILLLVQLAARLVGRRNEALPTRDLICHTVTSLGTGGAQRQVVEYLRSAQSNGSPIRLLVLFEYNDLFLNELEKSGIGCEIIYRRCRSSRVGRFCGRAFPNSTVFFLLWHRLRQLRPRCTYSWLFLANVITAPAARLAGVDRVFSSIRNLSVWKSWPEYRHWWYRPADRLSAPLNDVIVGNAQAVIEDYVEWSGIEPEKTCVIRNAIDVERFLATPVSDLRARLDIPPEVALVLTVGRLAHEKNHAMLLRCFAEIRSRGHNARLMVVGHGELEPKLRQMCTDLDVESYVDFVGKTSEPENFFRAADLFALSSDIEGLPNVLLEAQAFGLSAVTTRSGGSGEVVEDGSTGFVVEVGDEAMFVDRMDRLLRDPELRLEMGRRAQERMRSEFSIEEMVAAIDRLTGRTAGSG